MLPHKAIKQKATGSGRTHHTHSRNSRSMLPRVNFGNVEIIRVAHGEHSTQIVSLDFYEICRDVEHIRKKLDEKHIAKHASNKNRRARKSGKGNSLSPPPPPSRLRNIERPKRQRQRSFSSSPVRNSPNQDCQPTLPVRRALSDTNCMHKEALCGLQDTPPALPFSSPSHQFNKRSTFSLSSPRRLNSTQRYSAVLHEKSFSSPSLRLGDDCPEEQLEAY